MRQLPEKQPGFRFRPSRLTAARRLRLLKYGCWAVIAILGLLQVIGKYSFMDPDGLSYLEIGNAYLRGDWHNAINAYWSPLFSWLLGLAMLVFRPTPYWEFTTVHAVNYAIFLCSILCFDFFLRQLELRRKSIASDESAPEGDALPDWMWILLGYTLFAWAALQLIGVTWPTPDMLVTCLVYVVAGLTLKLCSDSSAAAGRGDWIRLGLALGIGYLAKAALLPIGLIFLLVVAACAYFKRRGWSRVLLAAAFFAIVALPFILALSLTKGRPTFGDSGKLNYSWSVNGSKLWFHWQGREPGSGFPLHPTREILDYPAVYEFGSPVAGSYPPWYDPSYWYEGVRVYFDFGQQLGVLRFSARRFFGIFTGYNDGLIASLFCLLLLILSWKRYSIRAALRYWPLIVASAAAILTYALVVLLPRYIAAFVVVLLLSLMGGLRLPQSKALRQAFSAAMIIVPLIAAMIFGWKPAHRTYNTVSDIAARRETHTQWQIAQALKRFGINPGDKVASIGYVFFPFWAHLAEVKVVAEMQSLEPFWLDASINSKVIDAFSKTGAKVIVAHRMANGDAAPPGWQRLEGTDAFVYVLTQPSLP
jgi:hypothetical protein